MAVFITHLSALWIYCSPRTAELARNAPIAEAPDFEHATAGMARDELPRIMQMLGLSARTFDHLDVLLPRAAARHPQELIRLHSWSGDLPSRSFARLGANIYIAVPEFVLFQLAPTLDRADRIQLAEAVCGWYLPADNGVGFVVHEPLVSVGTSDVLNVAGHWGSGNATALRSEILGNSRSAMESSLAHLVCLPRQFGGYGLTRPVLNQKIYLSGAARRIYRHEYCEADLMALGTSDIYEYLGAAFHRNPERDIMRTLALEHDGYRVHDVTIYQLVDPMQRNELMRRYAMATRGRLYPPTRRIIERRRSLIDRWVPRREAIAEDGSTVWEKPFWAMPVAFLDQ